MGLHGQLNLPNSQHLLYLIVEVKKTGWESMSQDKDREIFYYLLLQASEIWLGKN